jgi:hypothetical protein
VFAAATKNFDAMEYAGEALQGNREFIRSLLPSSNGWVLCFASKRLRDDKDLVMEMIDIHKLNEMGDTPLMWISDTLRGDKDVALRALLKNGKVLYAFSEELQEDETFMKDLWNQRPRYHIECPMYKFPLTITLMGGRPVTVFVNFQYTTVGDLLIKILDLLCPLCYPIYELERYRLNLLTNENVNVRIDTSGDLRDYEDHFPHYKVILLTTVPIGHIPIPM